ncbi:TonB-dependent receptor [Pleionea sp. CnH1-48]|uniref:TonB-dependent receptor n=1 Tax=Pleionea sp. CnH1-48 TaxID=2954494 RepID=UPI002096C7EA|nr:TonB-dependent receptor [Pleionea sp. CnH1-48]MCO7227282.1 TonB-dependent receptor [Pleionea sp. CnH1-48]
MYSVVKKWTPLLACLPFSISWAETVQVKLVDANNQDMIEGAKFLVDGSESAVRFEAGVYSFNCPASSCELSISHPEYNAKTIAVDSNVGTTSITLDSDQPQERRLVISAFRDPFLSQAPQTIVADNINYEDMPVEPDTLLAMVENTTGVVANGQGGIFQTYSIRGVAKHRVKTLIDSVPITTERRAGISASFIDPVLLDSVDVVRGPVSTFYGSGALGGVVNIFLTEPDSDEFTLGYQSQSEMHFATYKKRLENGVVAYSYRHADKGEAPDDMGILNNGYRQQNFYLSQEWMSNGIEYDFSWLQTRADDIGKSNRRFPASRITNYPEESHSVVKFAAKNTEDGWAMSLFAHPNSLQTDTLRPGSRINFVENKSLDLGGSFQSKLVGSENINNQWGVDWFSRRNVEANETETQLSDGSVEHTTIIDNGQQDDIALFVSSQIEQDHLFWHLGARLNWQRQSVGGSPTITDNAWSAFVGLDWVINDQWKFVANVANGFRFPSISERFFTGSTGRGDVISVFDLETEESLNTDLGIRWEGSGQTIEVRAFQMLVDNYIERIRLDNGSNTFVNLDEGDIQGYEFEYGLYGESQSLTSSYTRYLGRDSNNQWLADIPADRVRFNYKYDSDNWSVGVNWTHRREKNEFGDGEIEDVLESVDLVSAKWAYQINDHWKLSLSATNLLDELYFASADDQETFSPGRSIGLSVTWRE